MGKGKTRITANQQRILRQEQENLEGYKRRLRKQQRQERVRTYRSDGVTRCSKCPPTTCCTDCAALNKARIYAGLIRPREDPRPHPNNIMPCIPNTPKFQGSRPFKHSKPNYDLVSANVVQLGAGWFRAEATLNNTVVYSRKVRGRDNAWAYVRQSMLMIREGLRFERENG